MVERLRARQPEIERVVFARIRAVVSESVVGGNVEYETGLQAATMALIEYAIASVERDEPRTVPIPPAALEQVRRAVRAGVGLETVLMRYIAGYGALGEFLVEEADRSGFSSDQTALRDLRREHELLLEHLTNAIAAEHRQERERISRSPEQRCLEIVTRLISGESVEQEELDELDYELRSRWHLGMIAIGAGAPPTLRRLKAGLGHELLCVPCGEQSVWAWLGGQRKLTIAELERILQANDRTGVCLALGEPGWDIEGWRQTHREARLALALVRRGRRLIVHYAESRLLAAALHDPTLAKSLEQSYLAPLAGQRDGGADLRHTLRLYIDAGCNASSASCLLKVGRHTVESRVHTVEKLLGRPLASCLAELDVALRLRELDDDAESLPDAPALAR